MACMRTDNLSRGEGATDARLASGECAFGAVVRKGRERAEWYKTGDAVQPCRECVCRGADH